MYLDKQPNILNAIKKSPWKFVSFTHELVSSETFTCQADVCKCLYLVSCILWQVLNKDLPPVAQLSASFLQPFLDLLGIKFG